ncbi:hypothetical protein MKX01_002817 [Papaver californicum]|nr:hypothetical protein MKX01_002817 [Papaver californicum]
MCSSMLLLSMWINEYTCSIDLQITSRGYKKGTENQEKNKKEKRVKKLKNSSSCLSSYYGGGGDCYEEELEKQKKVLNSVSNESSSFEEDEDTHMFRNRLSKEVMELDEEMLDRFRDAGFWRSPSQISQRYCVTTECLS